MIQYLKPEMEIICFSADNIVITSNTLQTGQTEGNTDSGDSDNLFGWE